MPVNDLISYDVGLLGDGGGGNVEWWQDYLRAELERAHEFYADQFAAALSSLQAENERLRAHIAEQAEHAGQRIKDGIELGAVVWRIALEDVARENRAALNPEKQDG